MMAALNKWSFVGTLVAGGILGALVAGLNPGQEPLQPDPVTTPGPTQRAEPASPPRPHAPPADPAEPVLDALMEAHGRLASTRSLRETQSGLRAELAKETSYRELLESFFQKAGARTLVSEGEATAAGEAVLDLVKEVEIHGLNTAHYPLKAAQKLLSGLERGAGSSEAPHTLREGAGLRRVLSQDVFDRAAAREALKRREKPLSLTQIGGLEEAIKKAASLPPRGRDEIRAEIALARLLMTLVQDFRIFRRAGPFRPLTGKDEPFALYGDRPVHTLKAMVEIAASDAPNEALKGLQPPRSSYGKLVEIRRSYLAFAAKKCQRQLYEEWRLKEGKRGEEVRALQKRLACEGLYTGPIHGLFDAAVRAAVITYQRHHGLHDEGFVKKGTLRSLNVSLARRAAQIGLVLQRMRESKARSLGEAYIRVNIPSFELEFIEKHTTIRRHDVIVGTNRLDDNKLKLVQGHLNRTRLFTTELYQVIVNPDWLLPARVEKGEVQTKSEADPNYLKKNNIRRITLPSGKSALVQGRGPLNVLGKVKFVLRESNAIFLHDTNDRSLFRHKKRDFSHGCMRVKHAVGFGKWLLDRDGWEKSDVKRTFKGEKTQRGMTLNTPVPLITEYMTVAVSAEGLPIFFDDLYGYDHDYFKGTLPATLEVRWGSANLRPGWVPRVRKEVVESWRRKRRAAPRNYDPAKHGS